MGESNRTALIIMLAVAVVAGLVASFVPLGDAFWDPPASGGIDERVDEQYSLWTMDQDISRVGASDESNDSTWFSASHDGTGGITFLRAAPVIFTLALIAGLVALILVLPEGAHLHRVAGTFALFGAFMGAGTVILLMRGLSLRSADLLNPAGKTPPAEILWGIGLVILIIFTTLLLVGGIIALLRAAEEQHDEDAWDDEDHDHVHEEHVHEHHVHHHEHTEGYLRLMCPECKTIKEAPVGSVPTCENCGFHKAI